MFRYVNNFFNNFDNFFLYNYIIKKRFYAVFGRFLRYVTRVNNNYAKPGIGQPSPDVEKSMVSGLVSRVFVYF